jgi:hypothetical protein
MMQQMFLGFGAAGFDGSYSNLATSMTNSQGSATLANIGKMFDGDGTTDGWGGGVNGSAAAVVSFTDVDGALQWSSKIEIMGTMGATTGQVGGNTGFMRVNGYDIVPEMKSANQYYLGSPTAYVDITSKVGGSGTLSSITLQWIGGVANPTYFGIRLDDVELVDS